MRVRRTFCFLDLCGFTAFTDEHGDSAAVSVLAQLRSILRARGEAHGVRVPRWLGDGAMLSGVEVPSVFECVFELNEALAATCPLPLRTGVCAGPVIMFEGDDYIGTAVNAAARLCDVAGPGQVLAESSTADHVPKGLRATMLAPVLVPGMARPLDIREITRG